jgi:hypothetical protein
MKTNALIALSIVAAAGLGACSTPTPQQGAAASPNPKVNTVVHPYTPGQGTVTAVMPTPGSAAAGGSAAEPTQRLEIRMDNGAVQYVDVASKEFTKGSRVTLTQDKLIRKM